MDYVPVETITKYQGTQITSYPNRWLFGPITPWFGCAFS